MKYAAIAVSLHEGRSHCLDTKTDYLSRMEQD